ncbi:MAG: YabP/YqfC family sporulation protein [Bacilli bacterium]|nr:YabP/YqfC family sporulation protein [Bacilli bacterium]
MNLLNKLDRYIIDKEYKIIIKKNSINIINFKEIKDFSSTKIVIKNEDNNTIVTGENLVVSKMQDNEILITGKIESIKL